MSDALAFLDDLLASGHVASLLGEIEREQRVREALECEASLYTFLQRAWPWFDPAPFVGGWHLEAIAEHLSAVSAGQIKRLVINIPPRFGKTNLVTVAWPTWTWANAPRDDMPLLGPGVRFLCASYGATKAQADGVTARRLIGSTWYQERWGDRVKIVADRDNQEQYDTEAGGSRISTGIPESLGKGGAIRICFHGDQLILTEAGPLPIRQVVTHRLALRVPSLNERNGTVELKSIIAWHRNPGAPIVRLTFDTGLVVRCTTDHLLRVSGRNWESAADMPVGTVAQTFDAREICRDLGIPLVGEAGSVTPHLGRVVRVEHEGMAPETYCVTVQDNHNLFLGGGGSLIVAANCDDPHKTNEVESEVVRGGVIRAYDEIWRTRSNDPKYGAEVLVMQRQAENDLAGHILDDGDAVHLCLPLEYDPGRHCHTVIGFSDPRENDGELLWPARFDDRWVAQQKARVGSFAWSSQYQQSPEPRGGGIIKRDWWQVWPPPDEEDSWVREVEVDGVMKARTRLPDFEWVCVSVDTAYTDKQQNDWSACSVWGVFEHRNRPRIMLLHAWQERLELHDLVERIKETARRKGREADAVLVEGKASGISVVQELRRLTREEEFQLIAIEPKGDKTARAHAVVPLFTGGLVYAPKTKWADLMIDNVAQFPRARHDDLFDSATQALMYMRRTGLAQLASEVEADQDAALWFHGNKPSVAAEYGL